MPIILKSKRELNLMRRAGQIVAETLALLTEKIRPGLTTARLNELAHVYITGCGGVPTFLGYRGFPASICVSVNQELVHGIPGPRVLREGDIVSLDVGVTWQGWVADAATTVPVGAPSRAVERFLQVGQEALRRAIAQARAGRHLGDISWAVQSYVESMGYNVVREYVGHGVGSDMHEDPQIPNFGPPGQGPVLRPGMTFAIEPMIMMGNPAVHVLDDQWTVVTDDASPTCHFEHTVLVTNGEAEIITKG